MSIQELPDEMIMNIMKYMDEKTLIICTKVSRRIRELSMDKSLWQNVKVTSKYLRKTPHGKSVYHPISINFLKLVIENGCTFLDVSIPMHQRNIDGSFIPNNNDVTSLILRHPEDPGEFQPPKFDVMTKLINQCCSLTKLGMIGINMKNLSLSGIKKHSKTLTVLNLTNCDGVQTGLFREVIIQCEELVEANFQGLELCEHDVSVIGTNLSSKIVKLNLKDIWDFSDNDIHSLVERCKHIEVLHLGHTSITETGLNKIGNKLSNLTHLATSVDASKCQDLGTLPSLKYLWSCPYSDFVEKDPEWLLDNAPEIYENQEKLQEMFPHLEINPYVEGPEDVAEEFFFGTMKRFELPINLYPIVNDRRKRFRFS